MDEHQLFTVTATDGQAKRWMHDSRWFELPAGESGLFAAGPAQQAVTFFTTRGYLGEPECTVEIEPYDGKASLQPVHVQQAYRDEDGQEYGTLAELIAAVKARTTAAVERHEPPDDLEALSFNELRALAEQRGVTVAVGTSTEQLRALLSGG